MSPWVRLDEKAMEHPKVGTLPDGAFRLWVQGLAHCQKFLTDGAIDGASLKMLRAYSPKRVSELITARLWDGATDGAVAVHDYLDWNDSREHVMKIRAQGRERIKRLRGNGESNAECNAVTTHEQRANAMGVFCVSSSQQDSSNERERGTGGTSLPQRAGALCEWYADTHERLIKAAYIGNPRKDYEAALQLVAKFADAELQDAAIVWFGQRDSFATNGTRTMTKFASRASALVVQAREVAS